MSSNWWAQKLGSGNTPSSTPPTAQPSRPAPVVPPSSTSAVPIQYDADADQVVTKAPSSKLHDRCPSCDSGNYFAPSPQVRARCYDCGYPLTQAGTGVGVPTDGRVTPAKQLSTANNFNPTTIVGRLE